MGRTPRRDHQADPLDGLTLLERGWLSSNVVVVAPGRADAARDGGGGGDLGDDLDAHAVAIDAGHVNHAAQTLALVRHALGGRRLGRIVNTHLHSDHCGGNATLARSTGARIVVPAASLDAARRWDAAALSFEPTAQRIERFEPEVGYGAGAPLRLGGRDWQVAVAPGHDPDAAMLFDPSRRLLVSGDALWADGFGVVFPELVGEPGFDDVAAVLDAIERLAPAVVIPGHGPAFDDVGAALARARRRLAGMRADPRRHARHGAKVLVKYHLMEVGREPLDDWRAWAGSVPLIAEIAERHAPFADRPGTPAGRGGADLADELLRELAASGLASLDATSVADLAG